MLPVRCPESKRRYCRGLVTPEAAPSCPYARRLTRSCIEYNGTDARLAEELVAAGIPRNDIVLGFQPEELRSLSGFGIG